ncbi:MAG: M56 family metallopeptidase [Nannocystaceae bacterium]
MEWLLTYVVHSTALIASIWLLTTLVPKLSLGTRETLWKVALLGPLLTASVSQAAGVPSVWGELPVPGALRTEPAAASPAPAVAVATSQVDRRIVQHRNGELEITAVRHRPASAVAAAPEPASPLASPSPWPLVLLSLWAAGAAFAVGRLVWSALALRKQLVGRRDVIEDPVLESFLDLCSKAELRRRPRLTASSHLRSPIALGRREICLPERAVDSLTPPQQQGMLAHELAHLVRHDPPWMVLTAVIEAVFFFQPLNHLARRKIQEVAEFQCDDWAARQTGTGVHLAKCLAEVAGWVEDGPPLTPVATAMADRGSPIVRRITRLLHQRRAGGRVHPVGRVALTMGSLALVIALVPGVSQAQRAEGSRPAMLASADSPLGAVVIEDISDAGHERSIVRLQADGETVEIEVQAARPAPPPPPSEDRVEIIVGGVFGHPWWAWGLFDGLEVIIEDGHHHHGERHHHRALRSAERARRHAERDWERGLRRYERAAERVEDAVDGSLSIACSDGGCVVEL